MNAWTIYWVMQLDAIKSSLAILTFVLIIASAVTAFHGSLLISNQEYDRSVNQSLADKYFIAANGSFRISKKFAAAFVFCCIAASIIPSSRTAAAMVILPAIANNEQIKKEAGDLYGLAKQALTKLAAPDEKSK